MSKKIKEFETRGRWALILGGSKGLGLATARKLARHGYHLLIVHRDRRSELPDIENEFSEIRGQGTQCISFNCDALNPVKRKDVLDKIRANMGADEALHVVVHSIARGHLKRMVGSDALLSGEDLRLTLDAMAVSLYDWSRELISFGLLATDTRILSFTSEGKDRVLPSYGAVAAAKAALEAISRQMAVEMAPLGIRVNCIQAGVTETESFARIPKSEQIREYTLKRNPSGRLTVPDDVANVAYLLTLPEAGWITGTVIKADGGESLR